MVTRAIDLPVGCGHWLSCGYSSFEPNPQRDGKQRGCANHVAQRAFVSQVRSHSCEYDGSDPGDTVALISDERTLGPGIHKHRYLGGKKNEIWMILGQEPLVQKMFL